MSANNRLYILWTNDNVITAENASSAESVGSSLINSPRT